MNVTRASSSGPNNPVDVPVTVHFTAALGSTPGGPLPASASQTFTPVDETLTFPAGVATETVHVPVNPGAANPGSVPIQLSIASTTPGITLNTSIEQPSTVVYLVNGPSALPPTPTAITSAHLVVQGKSVTGIAITFSGPMPSASVEDLRYYRVTRQGPTQHGIDFFYMQPVTLPGVVPIPLKSTQYDPTTDTVTLVPKKPLKTSIAYTIFSTYPSLSRTPLTDLRGQPVEGNLEPTGNFLFSLKGSRSLNWPAPQPPKIFGG